MSAYKAVQLVCDYEVKLNGDVLVGCRRFRTIRVTSTASGIHEARDRAEAYGWTFDANAGDLCRVHSPPGN